MRFNHFQVCLSAICLSFGALGAYSQQRITEDEMPQTWQYSSEFNQTIPTSDSWWKQFSDPTLDYLISTGIDNNYDVLMAQKRIEIAKQSLNQTRAAYFPAFFLNGGWTKSQNSGMTGRTPGPAMSGSYFDLGIDMNWQIDVFGKISAKAKQSKAQYSATRAEYAAAMVSLASKIATAYFQLRTIQSEIAVLNEHIAMQDTVVKITKARHEAGLASMLDVTQALTTYYSTVASISQLKTSETATINSLSVMIGQFPVALKDQLTQAAPLPDYHQIIGVGVPMELLRRRPDIVDAEYTLASYAAALGIAKSDFLPTLSLSGSIGTSAHKIDNLFDKNSLSYAIAPTLSWTIFDGLGRKSAMEAAKQQMLAGIDNYNLTVLTAVQETESAMSAYLNDIEYIDMIQNVVQSAWKSLTLSVELYKEGLTTFVNVTNSQINYLQYSNELVAAKGQALADLVTLYQALGGGWQQNF